MTETKQIDIKIGRHIEGDQCLHFSAFETNGYSQREVIVLQITHFVIENDGKISPNDAFSFQPKSPLLEDETTCTARHRYTTRQHVS